jgi:hypothetical protein
MKRARRGFALGSWLVLLTGSLHAQQLAAAEADPSIVGQTQPLLTTPSPPPAAVPVDPPFTDPASCEAPPPNRSTFALYPPGMFGDLLVVEPVRPPGAGVSATLPIAFLSSFKISENESPRPLDRVFLTGNFYDNVDRSFLAPGPSANVYREMIGFEKTFLGGNASVGVRLPYFQLTGDPSVSETRIGDVSVLFKYAFINNPSTGNLASGGLVVTAPTGPSLSLSGQSSVNPTIFQPWLGGIWNWKQLYVQNFTAVAVPTDARDVSLFFKSVAVGYWLYRTDDPSRIVSAIVPDAELHLNTPLNHRGTGALPIGFPDTLDFTSGVYFYLRRALLGVSAGAPLTGPKPYDFQVNVNLNYRF